MSVTLSKPTNGSNADYSNRVGLLFDAYNNGNYSFPASQVASADANVLDDYEEGTFTSTITAGAGTFTSVSGAGSRYRKIGDSYLGILAIAVTTVGTAASSITATLPATAGAVGIATGRENGATGKMVAGKIDAATAVANAIQFYDATFPGASGNALRLFFFFG